MKSNYKNKKIRTDLSFFVCEKCGEKVWVKAVGTKNRNHCSFCLWSKHLDLKIPGDRKSACGGMMKPVGLCYKSDGEELMVVHKCEKCGFMSKNRIAGDDDEKAILGLIKRNDDSEEITELLTEKNRHEIMVLLFGKNEDYWPR